MNKSRRGGRKVPYLGRIKLKWCVNCNIPIIENKFCPNCNNKTLQMPITPPGDVRPAFNKEIKRIRKVIDEQYGISLGKLLLPDEKIILINKIPGLDLTEEIIMDGEILGIYLFDPLKGVFKFNPKISAAKRLLALSLENNINLKKIIEISKEAVPFILDGKSILAPGVLHVEDSIIADDHCIVLHNNQYITVAISFADSSILSKMVKSQHGKVAKNQKKNVEPNPDIFIKEYSENLKKFNNQFQDWNKIFEINHDHMDKIVEEAKSFIIRQKEVHNKKVAVAYSGGKDSQCVLLLAYDALGPNFNIFFADTGLELPEVMENTYNIARVLHMEDKLIIKHAGDKFWELIEDFGPPGRDYRFCCHTLKAQNIMNIIEELASGDKVLSFLGQRRYESFSRSAEKRVYVNSFVPLQIAASPIKQWCALEVWMYLLYYPHYVEEKKVDIPVTPLYFEGLERLGCYLCPASSLSTLKLERELHPKLMERWDKWLEQYSKRYNFPPEWIKYGLWRYKNVNKGWKRILESQGIKYELKSISRNNPISVAINKGISPCGQGGFSIKGKFNTAIDLGLVQKIIEVIPGEPTLHEDLGVISIKTKDYLININADGAFFIQIWDMKYNYSKLIKNTAGIVVKSQRCNNCGVCQKICPSGVIKIVEDKEKSIFYPVINNNSKNKCIHCNKCITHCPMFQKIRDTL